MQSDKVRTAFDDAANKYDNFRRQAIPLMDEFYHTAVELTESYNNPKILDLGAGTGILTELLHDIHKDSEITLVDFSKEMLNIARNKFNDIDQFNYLELDYLSDDFPDNYDIIISSLSIHHLGDNQKKFLYNKIYNHLNHGGIFINADEVRGTNDVIEARYKEKETAHLLKQDIPQEEKDKLMERRKLDKPATLCDNLKFFKDIGYVNIDVSFKYYRYFVISGQKE